MGRLFANFFKESGIKVLISDKKTKLSNEELATQADITIVSVPIENTEKAIQEILPYIGKHQALMDFTSIKEKPVKAMMKGKCEVLGIHPMFGDSNPIPGQTIILCPTSRSKKWSEWMENFLRQNHAQIHKMSPKEHDKMMNIAQGLVHFADITFADALRRSKLPIPKLLQYTGKASELKVQLAARLIYQDPGLYGNIQIENPQAMKSLKAYKQSVDELSKIVQNKNLSAFKKFFNKNKTFLGRYTTSAYKDSTYLIDKFLEKKRSSKALAQTKRPKKSDIAVLGPKNTYTDIGATKYLEKCSLDQKATAQTKFYTKGIDEIFDLVENGSVSLGIAPIENKLQGTVRETLDNLFYKKVQIIDEINIQINHALICNSHAKKNDIKRIISHTQALSQCKKYLKKNFPKATIEAYSSTAAATEKLLNSGNKSIAVIAPESAAEHPTLKIFSKNVQDEKDNSTTFIVINKGDKTSPEKLIYKTSIAFYFKADSPGSLFTVFEDFAKEKVNMTKIESRPTKAKFGEYIFYLDFDGHISEPKIKKLLESIKKKVAKLKVLGSY